MADLRGYVEGMIGFEGGGTTVVANPTGTPTDDLESIQIDETIYSVGGGENIVPTPTNIDRGKYLGVKSNANELEYREVREVPSGEGANAGDVLTHTISGESWLPPTKELPNYTSSDNGKVLSIDSNNIVWKDISGEYSETLLYQETGNIYTGIKELNDNISNYDDLIFRSVYNNTQTIYEQRITTSLIEEIGYIQNPTSTSKHFSIEFGFDQSYYRIVRGEHDNELNIFEVSGTRHIVSIIGVKY